MVAALSAGIAVACGGGDTLVLPNDGLPTTITVVKGDAQTGTVGSALGDSLIVRVTDSKGRPVEDQTVEFSVTLGGGTIAPVSATTSSDGRAGARWSLGNGAGTQRAQAKVTGTGAPANLIAAFTANAGASGAASLALVSGDAQTATAGSVLADSLVVRVTDASANPVAGVSVNWTVTGGGTASAASVATGADGRAAVKRTLGTTAGAQSTIATAGALTGSPVTFSATATVGSAGQLKIQTQPSSTAQSGAAFAQQPAVQLLDANNNPVAQPGVAIAVTLGSGPAGGTLIGTNLAATNANGLATFGDLGLSGPSGTYTLNFSGASQPFTGATSEGISIGAGGPTKLGFAQAPGTTAANGVPLNPQPRIQLLDAASNPVAQAGITVAVQAIGVSGGPVSLNGTTSATTDAAGIATFTTLSVTGPAGSQFTLAFAANALAGIGSGTIALSSGVVSAANSTVQVSGSPITASSGSSAATVTITARDAAGNPVAGATVVVSVTGTNVVSAPPSTDANGQSTVMVSSTQAGSKTVSATIAGVAVTQQASLVVAPAAPSATQSTVAAAPATIAAVSGTSTVTVTARDQFGNAVTNATVAVLANGASTGVTQPVGTTNASGVALASFSSNSAGTFTISATVTKAPAPAVTVTPTATVTVVTGTADAAKSTVVLSSATLVAGVGSVTATITARDAGNNALPGAAFTLSVTGNNTVAPASGSANGSGVATATISSTEAGIKTVSATVNGTTLTGQPTLTVTKATTTTSLTLTPASTVVGQSVTANFTVTPAGAGTPTGNVTVSGAGGTCTATVAIGTCALTPTTAAAGSAFSAVYGGDGNFTGSTGNVAQTVSKAGTTTAITSDTPSPSSISQVVTMAFTVSPVAPGGGTPAGSVTVTASGGSETCSAVLPVSNCALTLTTAGARTLVATYAGNGNYTTSTSAGTAHSVQANAATVTVGVSPGSAVNGQTVTLTASVAGAAGTPTGTVQFKVDGNNLNSAVTLSSGTALTSGSLAAGAHTITAAYSGDGTYGPATGSFGTYTVSLGATSTAISDNGSSPTIAGAAYSVSYSVAVTAPAAGTPTGTVTITDGAGGSCSGAAPFGSCQVTSSSAGVKTLTASYAGDTHFAASQASVTHTVSAATPTVALSSSAPSAVFGQPVTLTTTVTGSAGTPSGTVQFVIDGVNAGTAVTLSGSGTATRNVTLTVGSHTVSANYAGNATYSAGSASLAGGQTVVQGATSTTLVRSAGTDPSAVGTSVTFTATVTATAPAAGTPGGTVQFRVDGVDAGPPEALVGGAAAFSTSVLTAGAHSITAVFSGNTSFTGSTSAALSHTVAAPDATASMVSVDVASVRVGSGGTVTITVRDGSGNPLAGVAVSLSAAPAGGLSFGAAGVTNATGVTTAAFTGQSVGQYTVTVQAGGVTLADTPVVTVN